MAGRHASPNIRRVSRQVRRAALIEATLVCLRKYGHTGVSIRRISKEAGVSVGLINHYFPKKASLVATAYEKLAMSLLQSYRRGTKDKALTARESLRRFFDAYFAPEMIAPEMFKVWLVFWSTAAHDDETRIVYDEVYRVYRANLEVLLGDLRRSKGVPKFHLRRAAIGLTGLMDGLWLQLSLNPHTLKASDAVRACDDWVHALCVVPYLVIAEKSRAPRAVRMPAIA
ncbi:MAG TPA: transcriptional regulator BetI [Steroidobacteraceae bacterium]|jgi:AcrR family transcriptional regulator|nr:transcriptional regulator BetI [Steroidobacteraceae bacterium]